MDDKSATRPINLVCKLGIAAYWNFEQARQALVVAHRASHEEGSGAVLPLLVHIGARRYQQRDALRVTLRSGNEQGRRAIPHAHIHLRHGLA